MEMTGERRIPAPRQQVRDALNDPEVLRASIPGCESVEREGEDALEACVARRRRPHHHVEAEDRPDALRAHDVRDRKAALLVASLLVAAAIGAAALPIGMPHADSAAEQLSP